MDDYIKIHSTKEEWELQKIEECHRAYETCVRLLETPLSYEQFSKVWYSENSDKKGIDHISNMCMSIFQARKSNAGNGFEKAILKKHIESGIKVFIQVWVDSDGNIHNKKPKSSSVHKVDMLIPTILTSTNTSDMYIISKKTTLRERFRQDLDSCPRCKKVIFLTKETPSKTQIETITGYGCIVVYPYATNTENAWSYEKYFSEIKALQDSSADGTS